jgi:hypothetical protein
MDVLNRLPNWVAGPLFVVSVVVFSIIGLMYVRRRLHHSTLRGHNDVAGTIFAIIGTLYTVTLAFVVIIVWESLGAADERAAREAGTVGDLFRDSGFLPEPYGPMLQGQIRTYAESVIKDEWPLMATGRASDRVWDETTELFRTFSKLKPASPREVNIHLEILRSLNELSVDRRLRLLSSQSKVPSLMWTVLILGGVITVGFSFFLGVERDLAHLGMIGALAAMIALTLFLISAIDHPFSGDLRVEPDALRLIMDKYGTMSYPVD